MLEKIDLSGKVSKEDYEAQIEKLSTELGYYQRELHAAQIPVIVVFEGWRGAMRGRLLNKILEAVDPRGYSVYSSYKMRDEQRELPFFTYYWRHLPPKGTISFHNRAWYFSKNEHAVGDKDEKSEWYDVPVSSINAFEKTLVDDGYVLLKLFMHISKKQQKENLEKLTKEYGDSWEDYLPAGAEGLDYKAYSSVYERMFEQTDTKEAPWHIVSMEEWHHGVLEVFKILISAFKEALERKKLPTVKVAASTKEEQVPNVLAQFKLDQVMSEEDYQKEMKSCKEKLRTLQLQLYKKKISTIVGFEGWDAGGKGGAIKRFTSALDPLGFKVHPVAAPNPVEQQYNYLWRFWRYIPDAGEITVFDRTWYGRVMVERIEGFAKQAEWQRAYAEINEMELEWSRQGIIVQKFWLQIDKDEQYKRFKARETDPYKQWKITDEDWRNRDKWDQYETAVNEMLHRTNTEYAPWTVVEANCKYYARLKVLQTMIKRYEDALAHS